jgi:hypothetical protein
MLRLILSVSLFLDVSRYDGFQRDGDKLLQEDIQLIHIAHKLYLKCLSE